MVWIAMEDKPKMLEYKLSEEAEEDIDHDTNIHLLIGDSKQTFDKGTVSL